MAVRGGERGHVEHRPDVGPPSPDPAPTAPGGAGTPGGIGQRGRGEFVVQGLAGRCPQGHIQPEARDINPTCPGPRIEYGAGFDPGVRGRPVMRSWFPLPTVETFA